MFHNLLNSIATQMLRAPLGTPGSSLALPKYRSAPSSLCTALNAFFSVALMAIATQARAANLDYEMRELKLPVERSGLSWARLNKDARADLLITEDTQFSILYQAPDGSFDPAKAEVHPGEFGGGLIDVTDLDGDGTQEIVVLHARGVDVYQFDAAKGSFVRLPAPLLKGLRGAPFQHLKQADFLFDIDSDGDDDLVYPLDGKYYIYFQTKGAFEKKNQIASRPIRVRISMGDDNPRGEITTRLRIPRLEFADFNGDGRLDLRTTLDNRVSFYVQSEAGAIPENPSYEVDLGKFKSQIPKDDSYAKPNQFQFIAIDVNADKIEDYVIVAGTKIWVFLGKAGGPDFTKPDQIVKVSGEYINAAALPLDEDGRQDLLITKYSMPSLGRLIAGFAIGLRFEMEFLGYRNDQQPVFARTPTWQSKVVFKVPPIFQLLGEIESLGQRFKGLTRQARSTAGGDFNADGRRDIAKVTAKGVELYAGREGGAEIKADFYDEYGDAKLFQKVFFKEKMREVAFDTLLTFLGDVISTFQSDAIAGRPPDATLPAPAGAEGRVIELQAHDLSDDKRDEIILFLGPANGKEYEDDERQSLLIYTAK